jgi:hypothetical protein
VAVTGGNLMTLETLKLECSPEKTKIASLKEGFSFLGFDINSRSVNIRKKSREKFEDALKNATKRSHNFDAKMIEKVNQIIRGTINYFCTGFSHVTRFFHLIGNMLRRRLRCMKYKSMRKTHNMRLKNKHLARNSLEDITKLCKQARERWKGSPGWGKQMGVAR